MSARAESSTSTPARTRAAGETLQVREIADGEGLECWLGEAQEAPPEPLPHRSWAVVLAVVLAALLGFALGLAV